MFKRRYREVDVLLVDDIQFMEGKEGLQEEFFHTFNALHGADSQIVLSSDRPPDAIPTLEDRLRSRFKWGLITDIQPPDLETRLAILRKKAERDHSPVPDEVLEFIATHITDNIRELEGALIRVSAYASLNQRARSTLDAGRAGPRRHPRPTRQPRPITPELILEAIAEMFGFTVEELTAARAASGPLVTARQIGMYVFRELTDLSYPAIAREFGGRDHTTVIHAVEKIVEAHEGAPPDLRPGHRAHPAAQVVGVSAPSHRHGDDAEGQPCGRHRGRTGDSARLSTGHAVHRSPRLCDPGDDTARPPERPRPARTAASSTIHSPYYHYQSFYEPLRGRSRREVPMRA